MENEELKGSRDIDILSDELQEIANDILEGYTSGFLDDEKGYRISWEVTIKKFKN